MADHLQYPKKLGQPGFQNWISFYSTPFKDDGSPGIVDIALYMPADGLNTDYKAEFGAQALGTALGSITQGGKVSDLKAIADNLEADASKMAGNATAVGTLMFAAKKGEGMGALASKTQGAVLNPFMIAAYKGPSEMRTFSYTFDFWPENVDEASEINSIIKNFKMAMLPSAGEGDISSSLILGYPEKFKIEYFVNGESSTNKGLFGLGECVLTGMELDHTTESSVAFHRDGNPVHSQIKLSFMETEVITRERVDTEGL